MPRNPSVLDTCPGSVRQSQRYRIDMFASDNERLRFSHLVLTVNGETLRYVRRGSGLQAIMGNNEIACGFELSSDPLFDRAYACDRPFALICGYARMRVTLLDDSGRCVGRYVAQDIACFQDDPVDRDNVDAMMKILASSPEENQVIGWMSGDALRAKGGAYSLLQGGLARNSPRSSATYLSIVDAGLAAMEEAYPMLRSHAAARVQKEESVVDAAQVRRVGASEMQWLAVHLDVLRPAGRSAATSFDMRGHVPVRMLSARAVRSFDIYENRLCLAYLDAVAASLRDFCEKLTDGRRQVEAIRGQGGPAASSAGHSFANAAALSLQGAHRFYVQAAKKLRARAIRLAALYRHALPGVQTEPLSSLRVVRTKIFKEVRSYSRIYAHIERFCSYGEEVPGEDGLAVAALRLDRAYETYVLYCMLDWLRRHGFELDSASLCDYDAGSNPYFERSHVNNVYRLTKDATTVELFYEPVVPYGADAPAAGPALRRMRPGHSYVPDFVLTSTARDALGHGVKRTFVIDAKYRPRRNLLTRFSEGEPTRYEECVGKYIFGMVDSETLRIPDAMWLLCGLEDERPQVREVAAAPWAADSAAMPSGVALATPRFGMDAIFDAMGFSSDDRLRTGDAANVSLSRTEALPLDAFAEAPLTAAARA